MNIDLRTTSQPVATAGSVGKAASETSSVRKFPFAQGQPDPLMLTGLPGFSEDYHPLSTLPPPQEQAPPQDDAPVQTGAAAVSSAESAHAFTDISLIMVLLTEAEIKIDQSARDERNAAGQDAYQKELDAAAKERTSAQHTHDAEVLEGWTGIAGGVLAIGSAIGSGYGAYKASNLQAAQGASQRVLAQRQELEMTKYRSRADLVHSLGDAARPLGTLMNADTKQNAADARADSEERRAAGTLAQNFYQREGDLAGNLEGQLRAIRDALAQIQSSQHESRSKIASNI